MDEVAQALDDATAPCSHIFPIGKCTPPLPLTQPSGPCAALLRCCWLFGISTRSLHCDLCQFQHFLLSCSVHQLHPAQGQLLGVFLLSKNPLPGLARCSTMNCTAHTAHITFWSSCPTGHLNVFDEASLPRYARPHLSVII